MRYAELTELISQSLDLFRFNSAKFLDHAEGIVVNDFIAIPVKLSSSLRSRVDIEVIDEAGAVLGYLCCCVSLGPHQISVVTDYKYAAYINEVSKVSFSLGEDSDGYIFKHDYIVISMTEYERYKSRYQDTAPVWGGFVHLSGMANSNPFSSSVQQIVAADKIDLLTSHHTSTAQKAVEQAYGFERFLKLYHLLELTFDFDIVRRIKKLNDDLDGVGQVFKDYEREDIERLKNVLRRRCVSIDGIVGRLNNAIKYEEKCKDIFYKYGKDSNPIKKISAFEQLLKQGGFSESNLKSLNLFNLDKPYKQVVTDVAAYWIYRVRCCVAHSRIGEYVVSSGDEEFFVELAEPLLREVLCQVLQKDET